MEDRRMIAELFESVRQVDRAYARWASLHGLTPGEMQIYYSMAERQIRELTQHDLCEELGAPKTSVNSIVKRQVIAGRVELAVNPANKREKLITLTEKGERFLDELIGPLRHMEARAVASVGQEELEHAITLQAGIAQELMECMEDEHE